MLDPNSASQMGAVMVAAVAAIVGVPLWLVWRALWNAAYPPERRRRG